MPKVVLTIQTDNLARFHVGAKFFGGVVIKAELPPVELMTTAQVAAAKGVSGQVVRTKMADYNLGTEGKGLYNPADVELVFSAKKQGRKRAV